MEFARLIKKMFFQNNQKKFRTDNSIDKSSGIDKILTIALLFRSTGEDQRGAPTFPGRH